MNSATRPQRRMTIRNRDFAEKAAAHPPFEGHAEVLPRIRLHDLRHGWGSHAVANGIDVRTVSAPLGHSSASFTVDRYVHVIREAEERAAHSMVDVLLGP
jgi:integrase